MNPMVASRAAAERLAASAAHGGLTEQCWRTGLTHDAALAFYALLHEIPFAEVLIDCLWHKSLGSTRPIPRPGALRRRAPPPALHRASRGESRKCGARSAARPEAPFEPWRASTWGRRTGGWRADRGAAVPAYTVEDCALDLLEFL